MAVQADRSRARMSSLQTVVATALWAVRRNAPSKKQPATGRWLQLRCFFRRLLLLPSRLGCRFLLLAGLLQTLLENGNQINHLGRLWRFPWLLFDFFSASFDFFLDHFHKRFAIIVLVLLRFPL